MLQLGGMLNKPMQFKYIIQGGLGNIIHSRWAIFAVCLKK